VTGADARREALVLGVLALLPLLAHAPAWGQGQLIGPGDGAALHYPLRAEAWSSWRHGELPSWNPAQFCGTPLLAGYRPGALYPPMLALTLLPPFLAFQVLVLGSLSAAALLAYLYLRRLGAGRAGAYVAGLTFALGPYLVGHLGDTATLVAAPTLLLLLLAAEAYAQRPQPWPTTALALAVALMLLAGSPEAARAGGALLLGRLLLAHLSRAPALRPEPRRTALALGAGLLLAAPQLLPTLFLAAEAGRQVSGLAGSGSAPLPGFTGLVLRYVSHTPAPALALAALPLALGHGSVRVLGLVLAVTLALQWGRGPLAAPGALALIFDLALAVLAGLSLSAQWAARAEPFGRRLRGLFLFACLASGAALSISAAALGPLPQPLAGPVGVMALALILYFSLADDADPVKAGVFLLPLTVAFLLQPQARGVWEGAPTRAELETGTPTREALDHVMGLRREERILSLAREWPRAEAADLAFGGLGGPSGRRAAGGYDPMVPVRLRQAWDGMGVGGTLPGSFFRTDPARLALLGVRWVQVPVSALRAPLDVWGFGERLDLVLPQQGPARFLPTPITLTTELRLDSFLSESEAVAQGQAVVRIHVHLASGRELPLLVRAGVETAEWAFERADVRSRVAHERATLLESWREPQGFDGHRYLGVLPLPGRYAVDGLRFEPLAGGGRFTLARLALQDALAQRTTALSLLAGYVSDASHFREAAATPSVRLFELPREPGPARVAARLRVLEDDEAVLRALRALTVAGLDPARDALATRADTAGLEWPAAARAGRAEVVHARGGRIELRAEGPGLLVVAEGWDPGWVALLDERPARLVRLNHVQMGVALPAGTHAVALEHTPRGFLTGLLLAALATLALLADLARGRG
jgi:hypothetical protein